jgi:hypothetical protein
MKFDSFKSFMLWGLSESFTTKSMMVTWVRMSDLRLSKKSEKTTWIIGLEMD